MLKIKFFHTPRNKKFSYTPLYYDPAEEERKKRMERVTGQAPPGASIKGQFTKRREATRKAGRLSNRRAFIIIFFLLLLAYWLIFGTLPFM